MLSLLVIAGLVMSLVAHEVAHGYASEMLGDPTPRERGRLTANPLAHLTLWGTLLPIALYLAGLPAIGMAKPVPVDPRYYRDTRRGLALVAAAGPAANAVIAALLAVLLTLVALPDALYSLVGQLILVNLVLGLFNLLPVPPLDGSKILQLALPPRLAYRYLSWPHGTFLIIGAVVFARGLLSGLLILALRLEAAMGVDLLRAFPGWFRP